MAALLAQIRRGVSAAAGSLATPRRWGYDPIFGVLLLLPLPLWLVLTDSARPAPSGDRLFYLLLAAVLEEIVFRGTLLGWLSQRLRGGFGQLTHANIACASLFALSHLWRQAPLPALATLLPGLLFGYCRERWQSLLPAIALHGWYNLGWWLCQS